LLINLWNLFLSIRKNTFWDFNSRIQIDYRKYKGGS
jgi:hypothetical protein